MHTKAYERHWDAAHSNLLEMPPFSSESSASSVSGASITRTFGLRFPHACTIKKFVVRQMSGTSVPFRVDLLNRQDSSNPATLEKVLPTQTQNPAGSAVEVFNDSGYEFKNMDGTPSLPQYWIYLRLTLLDNPFGATEWEVALAGETQI